MTARFAPFAPTIKKIKRPETLVVALFMVMVALINPLGETLYGPDDWSYALTVRNLLDTGVYHTHDWSVSNIMAQAYWGALFSKLLGYSLVSLRLSTLALAGVGSVSLYFLARELDFDRSVSSLIAACWLASPLVAQYSFTFMTDIPFVTLIILSFLLYSRAWRLSSYWLAGAASIAVAASILVRQSGVALIPGVFLIWLWPHGQPRRWRLALAGGALPVMVGIWQAADGLLMPNWGTRWASAEQSRYVSAVGPFLLEAAWRVVNILQNLVFFCSPLLAALAIDFMRALKPPGYARRQLMLVTALIAFVLAFSVIGVRMMGKNGAPFLILYWPLPLTLAMLAVTLLGGALLARLAIMSPWLADRRLLYIGVSTLCLAGFVLITFKIIDRYIIALLPCALLLLARPLASQSARWKLVAVIVLLAQAGFTVLWLRGQFARMDTAWAQAEKLRLSGVSLPQIAGPFEWTAYQGAFDDYLAQYRDSPQASYDDFIFRWLPERALRATYIVHTPLDEPVSERDFKVIAKIPYQDKLSWSYVIIYQRVAPP